MPKPLVSIIILSYNNYQYLYEALESLLNQDYPNIELILSNDASKDFDKKAVTSYLKSKQKTKINNFRIINNRINLGTVKSLNNAIRLAKGEFLLFFAADDALYDNKVVSRFISAFNKLPASAQVVTAQLGMYDIHLKKLIQLFIKKRDIALLKQRNPRMLFGQMSTRCIIAAASTCYRTSLLKKVGYFDERYKLIEDWSSALRLSRLGITFYFEDFIAFKHRDGGISHGNIHGEKKLNKKYELDLLNIMKHEVLPYIDILQEDQRKDFISAYEDRKWRFQYHFIVNKNSNVQLQKFIKQNWRQMLRGNFIDLRRYFVEQIDGKKLKMLLLGIFLYLLPFNNVPFRYVAISLIYSAILLFAYQLFLMFFPRLVTLLKVLL